MARQLHDPGLTSQVDRAKRVVESFAARTSILLDTARMSAGVFVLNREDMFLNDVVAGILDLYAAKADFNGATLEAKIDPKLRGHWDRVAVETILANLVSNALKYGNGSAVEITALLDDRNDVVIRVSDSGPGIDEDQRKRIFEKFGRGRRQNGAVVGYGLGLWIARELALLSGGSYSCSRTRRDAVQPLLLLCR